MLDEISALRMELEGLKGYLQGVRTGVTEFYDDEVPQSKVLAFVAELRLKVDNLDTLLSKLEPQ